MGGYLYGGEHGINSNTSMYLPATRRYRGSKCSSAKDGVNVDFAGAKIYPTFCRTCHAKKGSHLILFYHA
jgi:cytochrome c5